MSKNKVRDLAMFLIRDIIGRSVTPADFRGRHMKSASRLLKEMKYDYDDVVAALIALKKKDCNAFGYESPGELPNGPISGMEILYMWGEPPLIERFLTPPERPPIYSYSYDKWIKRWGVTAIERGEWDGIYIRQDPELCDEWLPDIIGLDLYEESICKWQTLQETQRQKRQSSGT